jgi:hypothetical protein
MQTTNLKLDLEVYVIENYLIIKCKYIDNGLRSARQLYQENIRGREYKVSSVDEPEFNKGSSTLFVDGADRSKDNRTLIGNFSYLTIEQSIEFLKRALKTINEQSIKREDKHLVLKRVI